MIIAYTQRSKDSLVELLDFYESHLKWNKGKRELFITNLIEFVHSLESFPLKGQIESMLEHLQLGCRCLVYFHVEIVYLVKGAIIYIIDFFDSRQDPRLMKV